MAQSAMYQAFVEVVPEASGFTGALTGQVASSSAAAGAAGGKAMAGGMAGALTKAVPIIGAALATLSLGDYLGNAIGNAGDYEQNLGAVEQVFGDAFGEIEKFSETSAKSFGLSANQALVGAKDFGIFGVAAGLAGTDLTGFSTDLLALSADLAAFGNTTPEQAVTALAAGLRGESEPLRTYGVLLDDAALRARALEMGIYDGSGALTQQQRVLAAHAEIMAQTVTQQGQAARESDTLAGKQALLSASWEDISTKIGTAFMPIAEAATDLIINEVVPALEDFAAWLTSDDVQEWFTSITDGWAEAKPTFDAIVTVIGGVTDFLAGVFSGDLTRAWEGIKAIFKGAANAVVEGIKGWWRNIDSALKTIANRLGGWFQGLPGKVAGYVSGAGTWLFSAGRALIGGFIDGIGSMFGDVGAAVGGIMDLAASFFPNSPAQRGAFSGSGWTRLLHSGAAIGDQFADGLVSQYRRVHGAAAGLTGAASDGLSGATVSGRFEMGNGFVQLIDGRISTSERAQARVLRGGRQPV